MLTRLDYTGILIPQGINITLDYDNSHCKKSVKEFKIKLSQCVTAEVNDTAKQIIEESTIAQWVLPGVRKGETVTHNCNLEIMNKGKAIRQGIETSTGFLFSRTYRLYIIPVYRMWVCRSKPIAIYNVTVSKRLRNDTDKKALEEKIEDVAKENNIQPLVQPMPAPLYELLNGSHAGKVPEEII